VEPRPREGFSRPPPGQEASGSRAVVLRFRKLRPRLLSRVLLVVPPSRRSRLSTEPFLSVSRPPVVLSRLPRVLPRGSPLAVRPPAGNARIVSGSAGVVSCWLEQQGERGLVQRASNISRSVYMCLEVHCMPALAGMTGVGNKQFLQITFLGQVSMRYV